MINLFNYIDRPSPVHRLTGATKLLCLLLWSFAAMGSFDPRFLALLAVFSVVLFRVSRIRLSDVQNEKLKLEAELSVAGTDAYIENEARTRYGYLKPGELRFVITNPEALYSSGEETPQLQVVQEGDKP
jgi:cell division protein FtsB